MRLPQHIEGFFTWFCTGSRLNIKTEQNYLYYVQCNSLCLRKAYNYWNTKSKICLNSIYFMDQWATEERHEMEKDERQVKVKDKRQKSSLQTWNNNLHHPVAKWTNKLLHRSHRDFAFCAGFAKIVQDIHLSIWSPING